MSMAAMMIMSVESCSRRLKDVYIFDLQEGIYAVEVISKVLGVLAINCYGG